MPSIDRVRRPFTSAAILSFILSLAPLASALTPDQLLLVVNKNEPESQRLAEFYARARNVPDGRIVALDLPTTDELTFEQFDRDVVPPIRRFLHDQKLDDRVTCLVTF